MLWNKLEYQEQLQIIDKIVSLLEKEEDPRVQDGLMAAIHELELWSNSPIQSLEPEENIVFATDPMDDL